MIALMAAAGQHPHTTTHQNVMITVSNCEEYERWMLGGVTKAPTVLIEYPATRATDYHVKEE